MKTIVEELREDLSRWIAESREATSRAQLAEHERDGAIARAEAAEAALQALRDLVTDAPDNVVDIRRGA